MVWNKALCVNFGTHLLWSLSFCLALRTDTTILIFFFFCIKMYKVGALVWKPGEGGSGEYHILLFSLLLLLLPCFFLNPLNPNITMYILHTITIFYFYGNENLFKQSRPLLFCDHFICFSQPLQSVTIRRN